MYNILLLCLICVMLIYIHIGTFFASYWNENLYNTVIYNSPFISEKWNKHYLNMLHCKLIWCWRYLETHATQDPQTLCSRIIFLISIPYCLQFQSLKNFWNLPSKLPVDKFHQKKSLMKGSDWCCIWWVTNCTVVSYEPLSLSGSYSVVQVPPFGFKHLVAVHWPTLITTDL
jgi:hypothetical protein